MTRSYPAALSVLTGIVGVVCVRPALAEGASCSPLAIQVDASTSAHWTGLVNDVRQEFEARDDIDRCARIKLAMRDASFSVEVLLPDGRSATRTVSRREDVVPTLESLLLVPERTEPEPTSVLEPSGLKPPPAKSAFAPPNASPARARDVALGRSAGVEERDASEPPFMRQSSGLHIELSVVTGGRIGDGQASVGLGALSFLELSGWLVGFEGRVDRYRSLMGVRDGGALELAALVGRRLRFHNLALDLTAGPAAAMQGTATFEARSSMTGEDVTKSGSSTVPRLLLGARMSFSALSTVHPFVGIDGELGPSRAGTDVPGASRLPVWTLGLALGATVGTK